MRLKPGVKVRGIRPEIVVAMMVADDILRTLGIPFVVTSVVDSVHSETSLHYDGAAFDMRTRNMDPAQRLSVRNRLREDLGDDFDVILERDHIHVEWQPKR